uniref:Uncharacterized protein n=1 Tax=Arundo donax TaxID=35708 RepID=A0A0A9AIN4_ARUDO
MPNEQHSTARSTSMEHKIHDSKAKPARFIAVTKQQAKLFLNRAHTSWCLLPPAALFPVYS